MKKIGLILLFVLFGNQVFAELGEGRYEVVLKKAENKENNRWSLAEWYETKNKMKLMDMWLALHSSDNPYEFFLGYGKGNYDKALSDGVTVAKSSHRYEEYTLDAFASIVGLHYKSYNTSEQTSGWNFEFLLRLLGTSNQNTNLTIAYGLKNRTDASALSMQNFENSFYKAKLTFYLIKYFGLDATYEIMNAKVNSQGVDVSGNTLTYSAFIDYGFIRIYTRAVKENETFASGSSSTIERNYSEVGAKLFF